MPTQFRYAPEIRHQFPQLCSRTLLVDGIDAKSDASIEIARLNAIADKRLVAASEGEFPEIQAWRRAFAAMGLKPTQYRCASEALLRRYRKEGSLPTLHPLIDLCNAASLAFAIPVAVFDTSKIMGTMTVRFARGDETYESFSGDIEHPEAAKSSLPTMTDAPMRAAGRTGKAAGPLFVRLLRKLWSSPKPCTKCVMGIPPPSHPRLPRRCPRSGPPLR